MPLGNRLVGFASLVAILAVDVGPAVARALPAAERATDLDRGGTRELPAEATFSDTPYNAREAPSIASSLGPYADPGG
ncbi:hypothetical protein FV242_06090 [Methylobacterium sp. WL64]|nr:hypothetical protein [Methylobacterium sp. WL64]TXN04914.1 hypothetical protein FV242_06090 [Methylobacterium sp. WL64]